MISAKISGLTPTSKKLSLKIVKVFEMTVLRSLRGDSERSNKIRLHLDELYVAIINMNPRVYNQNKVLSWSILFDLDLFLPIFVSCVSI